MKLIKKKVKINRKILFTVGQFFFYFISSKRLHYSGIIKSVLIFYF